MIDLRPLTAITLLLLCGCPDSSEFDFDGDGWPDNNDCEPDDPAIHPGADEVCDGIDNDCNDEIDEDFDEDRDGYLTCGADGVPGTADDGCEDDDDTVYPGADEGCDGIDTDCVDGPAPTTVR